LRGKPRVLATARNPAFNSCLYFEGHEVKILFFSSAI
jgi:hypothetical protein